MLGASRAMPPYRLHVFICTNRRPDGDPKGSCGEKGSEAVLSRFKELVAKLGLKGEVRANAAGCMDACAFGITVVVYPEGVWYGRVKLEDVDEIVQSHLIEGRPVERLRLRGHFESPRIKRAVPSEG
jgi:(2Fe-2S) ferredoxin